MAVSNEMRILLQLCCAPDGTVPLDILLCEGNEVICFFTDITYTQEEYERRLAPQGNWPNFSCYPSSSTLRPGSLAVEYQKSGERARRRQKVSVVLRFTDRGCRIFG